MSNRGSLVLSTTVYYVLRDGAVHDELRKELSDAFPDPRTTPTLAVLEQLPYLVSS